MLQFLNLHQRDLILQRFDFLRVRLEFVLDSVGEIMSVFEMRLRNEKLVVVFRE